MSVAPVLYAKKLTYSLDMIFIVFTGEKLQIIQFVSYLHPATRGHSMTNKHIRLLCLRNYSVYKTDKIGFLCACVQIIVFFLCGFLKKKCIHLLVSVSCLISLLYVAGSLIFNIRLAYWADMQI